MRGGSDEDHVHIDGSGGCYSRRIGICARQLCHASYALGDADEIIATAPKVESVLNTPEGRALVPDGAQSVAAMRIIKPKKLRLQVVLAEPPSFLKVSGTLVPHENALRAIGWNPPPAARRIVTVKTRKGATLRAHLQDVLADPLVKEVPVGDELTLWAILYYYDQNGPGLIVNEFSHGWH